MGVRKEVESMADAQASKGMGIGRKEEREAAAQALLKG